MRRTNDPRFWGKVAASGGVKQDRFDSAAFDQLLLVEIARKRLAKGATICRPKGARGFKSLRVIQTEATHALGQAVMTI